MDMEDDYDESLPAVEGKKSENPKGPPRDGDAPNGILQVHSHGSFNLLIQKILV